MRGFSGALSKLLLAIFAAWLAAAQLLYTALFGPLPQVSSSTSLGMSFRPNVAGYYNQHRLFHRLLFCRRPLAVSVVSFPLLLDRDVGAAMAIVSSIEAVRETQ